MPYTFNRVAGMFRAPDGRVLCSTAYSGHGAGINNPAKEAVHDVGPIPAGTWLIGPPQTPQTHLGPLALPLTPAPGTDAFGRTGFFIHGDNARMDHSASDGCVILPHDARAAVAAGEDHALTVV